MVSLNQQDTIVAQATPAGRGGVSIVRISGAKASDIAERFVGFKPKPRFAHFTPFYGSNKQQIDEGIALYFPNPNSFTGEDVFELQGHGGPVVTDMLIKEALRFGARLANPGEFSERAFLNDKLDLTQAEAIADLIDSASEQAAQSALRSMSGVFSKKVHQLLDQLIALRMYVEAAIDFPEEEIDFLSDGKVQTDVTRLLESVNEVIAQAKIGSILREGMTVVIAGRPNAGKSSLLNQLTGKDSAIVTDIAGTTRDVLKEHIHIDGMPLHIVDTAGLREAPDEVEKIGIERAWQQIQEADRILLVVDSGQTKSDEPIELWPEFVEKIQHPERITVVRNKSDISNERIGLALHEDQIVINISAKLGLGIDELKSHLKDVMGYDSSGEGGFMARARHVHALERALQAIEQAKFQLEDGLAGELMAEDLKLAQNYLNEITGEFTSDDLLGKIFGSFCIGK